MLTIQRRDKRELRVSGESPVGLKRYPALLQEEEGRCAYCFWSNPSPTEIGLCIYSDFPEFCYESSGIVVVTEAR
jgi:hypothetical protein